MGQGASVAGARAPRGRRERDPGPRRSRLVPMVYGLTGADHRGPQRERSRGRSSRIADPLRSSRAETLAGYTGTCRSDTARAATIIGSNRYSELSDATED